MERLPTPQALAKAIDGGWSKRRDAVQMLGFLGRDAEAIQLALDERDAQVVVDEALKFLPAPVELVVHALTMKRGDAASRMLYTIPMGNFLYAEKEIVRIVAKSPAKLTAPLIESFGHAGFATAATVLRRHAQLDEPRTYADALAAGFPQNKPSVANGSDTSAATRQWDGPTERAFAAVGALRRLGQPIDIAAVTAWRDRLYAAIPETNAHYPAAADALLSWALFDAGVDESFERWLALEYLQRETRYDMVATLLRRGDAQRLVRLAPTIAKHVEGAGRYFCHWPVADWCHSEGLMPAPDVKLDEMYCLSRDAGIAPPAWWQWRTPWQPGGFHHARLRGLL
ncbi:MAG TPA: hypothetical protein VLF18_14525 [Tahibacter sp.]|uniref:hypothetical protein n=1 Tax=Tahibacter sp. TaxID=2056211 RepID=UPI002CE3DED4|nr:hypothetical protein [Tahibacter sp.]HSX61414.1 hypothetical protein [Tahibacter sp.]